MQWRLWTNIMPNARSALVNFREREIRSIFYVARNFPPRRFLSLCSQLKSQDLSWWFHASSVLRRDTILFARALNREDESFWPVYKIIFFRILYDWHWESVALKNCTRRDQLKIAGQSDQFGQWRFTENNSVDNGFKFLQFSHFFSFSSKRFLIETSQFKYFVKQNFILLFQQVLLTKLVDECLRLNVNVFVVVAFDILTAYFEVYLTRYVRLLLHLCYILRAMLEI